MSGGHLVGNIFWAVILSCISVLGLTGCGGDSGPTPGSLTITTAALPQGTVNQSYSASVSGSGGALPYTWSVSPALPANLSLDTATGAITGTPTTAATTTHMFTLRDSSAPSQTVQQSLSLTVAPPPAVLTITTTSLPDGTVNQGYNRPVQASGGTPPLTWNIVAGAGTLPPGLNLNRRPAQFQERRLPQGHHPLPSGLPTRPDNRTFKRWRSRSAQRPPRRIRRILRRPRSRQEPSVSRIASPWR